MKGLKMFMSVLAASALMFSCSDDDDKGSSTGGEIKAKWNPVKTVLKVGGETITEPYDLNENDCNKDYVNFADANVLEYVIYFKNASDVCTPDNGDSGTWAKDGNTLTINDMVIGGDNVSGTYEITRLTGSELRMKTTSTIGGISTTAELFFTKATNQD